MKTNYKILFSTILISLVIFACQTEVWDEHYNKEAEILEKGMLVDELAKVPGIAKFTNAVKETGIDSILAKNQLYTVFAFNDQVFDAIPDDIKNHSEKLRRLLLFHIYLNKMPEALIKEGLYKTLSGKYSMLEQTSGGDFTINTNSIITDYDYIAKNGVIHILDQASLPNPNLYEFLTDDSKYQKYVDYILNQKYVSFDRANSEIIGFNDNGNPIYDSVFVSENTFLADFPIDSEDDQFTMLLPSNINSAIEEAKSGIPLKGAVPDDFFVFPIMKSSLLGGVYKNEELNEEMLTVNGDKVSPEILALVGDNNGEPLSNGRAFVVDGYEIDKDAVYREVVLNNHDMGPYMTKSSKVRKALYRAGDIRIEWTNNRNPEPWYGETVTINMPHRAFLPLEYKFKYHTHAYASSTIKIEVNGRELPNSPWGGEKAFLLSDRSTEQMVDVELGSLVFDKFEQGVEIKLTFFEKHTEPGLRWSGATNKNYSIIYNFKMEPVID